MSFKCAKCKAQQPAGQPVNYVVTETRTKVYENEIKYGKMRGTMEQSTGSEIVRQIEACPTCYKELTGLDPRILIPVAAVSKNKKVHQGRQEQKRWNNPRGQKPYHQRSQPDNRQHKDQKPQRQAPVVEVVNKINLIKE